MVTNNKVFKVKKKTATIDFAEDSPWHGVEATVSISVPFSTLFWFQSTTSESDPKDSSKALQKFGDEFLLGWNVVDDDGVPIPTTGDGILAVSDTALVTTLMAAWVDAVVQPSENLEKQSNGTNTSANSLTNELANMSESLGS